MPIDSAIYDITKNVIVAAPAGSGKTEKLSRRYIALLSAGIGPERILAITFTEKAAAEMKDRILRILKNENPELYKKIKEKIFLMRISTIHSFCLSLLKRFAFELNLDPNFEIVDPKDSGIIDSVLAASFTGIIEAGAGKNSGLAGLRRGLVELNSKYSWSQVKKTVEKLFMLRPSTLVGKPELLDVSGFAVARKTALEGISGHEYFTGHYGPLLNEKDPEKIVYFLNTQRELFLTTAKTARKLPPKEKKPLARETYGKVNEALLELYRAAKKLIFNRESVMFYEIFIYCNEQYFTRKKELNVLDFNDLEYITYCLLNDNPEVDNILFAFDEQTDHVLLDEFQDTNFLQWSIINKLTEEWHSGLGSKRDSGINPTMFIVGDEKQSIYGFRNANVEVFDAAAREMKKWYGNSFLFQQVSENYRCGSDITGFVNGVFSRIMAQGINGPKWRTRYERFYPKREISGKVEIIEIPKGGNENTAEAESVAGRIKELLEKKVKYIKNKENKELPEKITGADIAVLLRKRTHLADFEEAFEKAGIDYVVINGLGFYQQPEVIALRALLFTLIEPSDDLSVYLLLKSPLLKQNEDEIFNFIAEAGIFLYEKICKTGKLSIIREHVLQVNERPLSHILESFMEKAEGWKAFFEPQRAANIKKFIELVQNFETEGSSLQDIRAYFEERVDADEEPKANLSTEDTDAVKIMTVHTAKGLEFPVVFFVRMGEEVRKNRDSIRINEKMEKTGILYCPDKEIREQVPEYIELALKEEEEEKRIFYVAVTRARDYLVLSGVRDEKNKGFWKYLA